jgi:guanylate kinase
LSEDERSAFSVSYTTRKKRPYEEEGRHYHFVSEAVFRDMIEKGLFAEWEVVHGDLYGTPRRNIERVKKEGIDLFLDVDVNGALKIKRVCHGAVLIFVLPPSKEELLKRLEGRGERELDRRLMRYEEEVEKRDHFDYTIVNKDLEDAYREFKKIIQSVRREMDGEDHR